MRAVGPAPTRPASRVAGPTAHVEVVVVDYHLLDDVTKPGTFRVHGIGSVLWLPVSTYRRFRLRGMENVAREYVRVEAFGRTYLHAIHACGGRLVGPQQRERLHVGGRLYTGDRKRPKPLPHLPQPERIQVVRERRQGAGCGCRRTR